MYKLLIVTQSPPSAAGASAGASGSGGAGAAPSTNTAPTTRPPKHGGYDRTGDWTSRTKITQELAKVINDGLYYYEQDLWEDNEWVSGTGRCIPRVITVASNPEGVFIARLLFSKYPLCRCIYD